MQQQGKGARGLRNVKKNVDIVTNIEPISELAWGSLGCSCLAWLGPWGPGGLLGL